MNKNRFDNKDSYKLYRNLYSVIHPSISKNNLTKYRIIMDEKLLPVRVYYPKRISDTKGVVIYINGYNKDELYGDFLSDLAIKTECTVIGIDYDDEIINDKLEISIYNTLKYIYKELVRIDINVSNIVFMGDREGSNLLIKWEREFNSKLILFAPTLKKINIKNKYLIIETRENEHTKELKNIYLYNNKINDLLDKINKFIKDDKNEEK